LSADKAQDRIQRGSPYDGASTADQALAEELVGRGHAPTRPTEQRIDGFTLANGYAVSAAVAADEPGLAAHRQPEDRADLSMIWDRIGLEYPVWAPVYDDGIHQGADEISVAALLAPKIEIEVILGFDRPVPVSATGNRLPTRWVGQLLASRSSIVTIRGPDSPDMVADFGCHAALVVGTRRRVTTGCARASDMKAGLQCDGEDVATGAGADVLGGPIRLRAVLASPESRRFRWGRIATGALTRGPTGQRLATAGPRGRMRSSFDPSECDSREPSYRAGRESDARTGPDLARGWTYAGKPFNAATTMAHHPHGCRRSQYSPVRS
jgi:2-keto-4-pentenoate hydratase